MTKILYAALAAMLFLAAATEAGRTEEFATELTCGCDAIGAGNVVFLDDPLVSPEFGYTAFVYPDMVTINEAGECLVENEEAFSEGEPMATFVHGADIYGQILIFYNNEVRNPGGQFATLDEVEAWAESICYPSVS